METEIAIAVLFVGLIIVMAIMTKFAFRIVSLPAITGYFILGFLIKLVGEQTQLLGSFTNEMLNFLGSLGVVALLFRIGLESKISELIRWLPKALFIWSGDILLSAFLGFTAAYYLLELSLIHSLFVAAAFTPTSVGISVAVWEEMKMIKSKEGEIMLDTAELDDLSGILIMGVLFLIVPLLHNNSNVDFSTAIISTVGLFLLKILLFGLFCYLIAHFAEQKITGFLNSMHSGDSAMLVVMGIGLIIASLAAYLGFSIAIGAFFAGLIFSSDPSAVKIDASFEAVHDLFVPFFFVGIGMAVDPVALSGLGTPLLILLTAAVVSKLIGAGVPALISLNKSAGLLIGISMIPRAEIALIIIQRGRELGDWAVSPELFAWIVIISAITAVLMPIILRYTMKTSELKLEKA